jgi:uncharacterized protein (TIGR02145 family)
MKSKRLISVIIFGILLSQNTNAQYPVSGLSGYYPLNGNANDMSGNGFNGVLNGQTLSDGICSQGYQFHNNFIDCGDPPGNEFDITGDATISMWVKLTQFSWGYYTLIGKDISAGDFNKKWFLAIYPNFLTFHINGPYPNSNGGGYWINSNTYSFTPGIFYHIVITKSGEYEYQFFINSLPAGVGTLPYNVYDVPFNLRIGKNEESEIYAVIDEVFIYDRALSLTEIEQLNRKVSVSITASSNPFVPGSSVAFTATPVNGGGTPDFQWFVNGIPTGTNSNVFTYMPLNADVIKCRLTSSDYYLCNPAESDIIQMVALSVAPVVVFSPCFQTTTTLNAKPVKLKGGLPLGGVYSGSGVNFSTAEFFPNIAGLGSHNVIYTYTNIAGMSSFQSVAITVNMEMPFICGDDFIDTRDNEVYPTMLIGSQCWMTKNLRYGSMISTNSPQTDNCIFEKYCYDDLSTNCSNYGGLYQWDEVMDYQPISGGQGLCPPGWHVPSVVEWTSLILFFSEQSRAGFFIKAVTNPGSFNAEMTGALALKTSWFLDGPQPWGTLFWTSDLKNDVHAFSHGLNNYGPSVSDYPGSKNNAYVVRCLKD